MNENKKNNRGKACVDMRFRVSLLDLRIVFN